VVTVGSGASAFDVDHEVVALLDRFEGGHNLVINTTEASAAGWPITDRALTLR